MADAIAISSIIVSVVAGLVVLFRELHIQKCHSLCIDSDCRKKSSCPPSPIIDKDGFFLKSRAKNILQETRELEGLKPSLAELKETLREIYILENNENNENNNE